MYSTVCEYGIVRIRQWC